jgi:hypothetical protein
MPTRSATRPVADRRADAHRPSTRWHSLDVLKGVALWAMVAHHFQKWTGGEVDGRFIGFETFVVTDLAAPVFAVALGAAAVVVGHRVSRWSDLAAATWRWAEILAIGLAIDLVTHGAIEGRGVLPTLAILGLAVTVATAAGVRNPWVWWLGATACAVIAVPATQLAGDDPLRLLLNGPFALPVYGVFAASGAAVAAHAIGRPERSLPLVRSAVGVLVVGLAAATFAGGVVAPEGVWPPARYPGHLGFTLWGLVAALVVWAGVRALLPAGSFLGEAAARAGRRTLVVFGGHFVVKLALHQAGLLGDLDTWRWGAVAWVAVALVCAASALPERATQVTA